MKAYKISTLGFNAYVEDMNGECLGKCSPKSKMAFDVNYSITSGVDPMYVIAALTSCASNGGAAGAAAGAGAIWCINDSNIRTMMMDKKMLVILRYLDWVVHPFALSLLWVTFTLSSLTILKILTNYRSVIRSCKYLKI